MTFSNGQIQPCNFVLAHHGVSNLARHMKNHHQYIYLQEERNPLSGKNAKVLEVQTVSLAARSVNPGQDREIAPMSFDAGLSLKQKIDHQRRCVLLCSLNLRPENMLRDEGLALVLGGISPWHAVCLPSHSTFNIILQEEYTKLEVIILDSLHVLECSATLQRILTS